MKKRLLDFLACPACGSSPLRLERWGAGGEETPVAAGSAAGPQDGGGEIVSGALLCGCGRVYPVLDGIPRLLVEAETEYPDFYQRWRRSVQAPSPAPPGTTDRRSRRSFGFQWATYREGERTWFKEDRGERKDEFLRGIEARADELVGRTLLDAGCGNGELSRAVAEHGLEVVALDFSRSVEQAHRRLTAAGGEAALRVHYLQGDVLRLPLVDARFDLVHSSGVLHHTASTAWAFRSLARAVKPGGKIYVQLYRRRPGWIHAVNVSLRAVSTRVPLRALWRLCLLAAPLHGLLSRLVHALRGEPFRAGTRRERALQMFDNYSPRFQHRHSVAEIRELFASAGFPGAREVTFANERRHMLAMLGHLPAGPPGPAPAAAASAAASPLAPSRASAATPRS